MIEQYNIVMVAIKKTVSVNEYHKQLGHPNITVTRSTAKTRNVTLKGTPEICKDCLISKAKKKSVPKRNV